MKLDKNSDAAKTQKLLDQASELVQLQSSTIADLETELQGVNRALHTMIGCNRIQSVVNDEKELLQEICNLLTTTVGYKMAWVGYVNDDAEKSISPVVYANCDDCSYVKNARLSWSADSPYGQGPGGISIREKRVVICNDFQTDERMAVWKKLAAECGFASAISVPLVIDDKSIGALLIYSERSDAFDEMEVSLLSELGSDVAFGVAARRSHQKVFEHMKHLKGVVKSTLRAISNMIELRDPYTAGHENRVCKIASAIAHEMNLDIEMIEAIEIASMVHDIGKIAVPAEILSKPGRLGPIEFDLIKTHPALGHKILKEIDFKWKIPEIVLQHHERLDGTGYPQGLKGDQICLEAKIVSVADVVEAMSSHRPYRPGLGIDLALQEIKDGAGTKYDSVVVEACVRIFDKKIIKIQDL